MLLFKRLFFILLGALGTLFLDADPAHGLSKDEALKRCEARITVLEQQKSRFSDKISNLYALSLDDFKKLIEQLRKSEDPPQIMSLYTTLQEGLTAVEWILNRYGKAPAPAKVESLATPVRVPLATINDPNNVSSKDNKAKSNKQEANGNSPEAKNAAGIKNDENVKPEVTAPSVPAAPSSPTNQKAPAIVQKAKAKKRVASKPGIVKINKKKARRPKAAAKKVRHKASRSLRNTVKPA